MARSFDGSGDSITPGSGVTDLTSSWTWSFWFKRNGTSHLDPLISRWTNSTTNRQIYIYVTTFANDNKLQVDIPWVSAVMTGGSTITDTNWHHCAVTRSGSSWVLYLDGASDATASDGSSQETGGSLELGLSTPAGGSPVLNGGLAEVACWSAALTAAEVVALSKGFSPLLVRTATLEHYWPLIGNASPEPDLVGGVSGTVVNAAAASHPRVIYPRRRVAQKFTTAGGGGGPVVPVFVHHRKMQGAA